MDKQCLFHQNKLVLIQYSKIQNKKQLDANFSRIHENNKKYKQIYTANQLQRIPLGSVRGPPF